MCKKENFTDPRLSSREIGEISRKIGRNWREIGINMGYSSVQLDQISEMHRESIYDRNVYMMSKWYEAVELKQLSENPRRLLAHCVSAADDAGELACSIDPCYEDIKIPEALDSEIQKIIIGKRTSEVDLHEVLQSQNSEQIDCVIQLWKDLDKRFLETRACRKATMCFDTVGVLTLIGPPGEGKSVTAHHIALQYISKGYQIVPVTDLKELENLCKPTTEQLFVLDDPLGAHDLDQNRLSEWVTKNDKINGITRKGKTKIISTIRKTIYQQCKKEIRKTIFSKNVVDLSADDIQLNESERESMLKIHCDTDVKQFEKIVHSSYFPGFPLLCHFLKIDPKSRQEIDKDFNPSHVVLRQIEELADKNKFYYCSLVLLAMFNGSFYPSRLYLLNRLHDKKREIVYKMENIIKDCGVTITPENIEAIKNSFEALNGVYFVKTKEDFHFLHDAIFSAVAYYFGKEHIELILEYSNSKFICERVRIVESEEKESCDQDFTKLIIEIPESEFESFAERLTNDINNLNHADVFRNPSIYNQKFQSVWIKHFTGLNYEDLKEILLKEPEEEFEGDKEVLKTIKKTLDFAILSSTPIHWLCRNGMLKMLKKILSKFRNVNDFLNSLPGHTNPLHFAAGYGHLDVVKFLIEKGQDVNSKSCLQKEQIEENLVGEYYTGFTPLFYAARENHLDVVEFLLQNGAEPNLVRDHGASPMLLTADRGHYRVVETLIQHGGDPNLCCDHGTSPLILAASENHYKTVKVLIDNKANLNMQRIETGVSAVFFAAMRGHCESLTLLLDSGADLNLCNKDGLSPLAVSVKEGHLGASKIILEKGANVDISDKENNTPLYYSMKRKYEREITSECEDDKEGKYNELIKLMIEKGADPEQANIKGETAKSLAEKNNDVDAIRMMAPSVVSSL